MSKDKLKTKIFWKTDATGREFITDETNSEIGYIYRAKDIDGDLHWMYSVLGHRLAARSREMARTRLEAAAVEVLHQRISG